MGAEWLGGRPCSRYTLCVLGAAVDCATPTQTTLPIRGVHHRLQLFCSEKRRFLEVDFVARPTIVIHILVYISLLEG